MSLAESKIPGYQIVRALGQGGMATVFLAIQESFEREVALKVMSEQLEADPTFGERFLREAKIVSKLIHPHIVTVYDVGTFEGRHFLSMEYIPGEDLKAYLEKIPLLHILRVIKEIALALDYAGRKGYIHRDIKPENIMIKSDDGRAILMDFGIARACDNLNGMTQTGTAIGTPYYMSPEQAKGGDVDARSDLYSLGVVFFQLLSGKVPYSGDSAISVGIKHISDPIPELAPELAPLFQTIVNRLMAKQPNDRFQCGMELINALNELEKSEVLKLAEIFDNAAGRSVNKDVFNSDLHSDNWRISAQQLHQTGNDLTIIVSRTAPGPAVSKAANIPYALRFENLFNGNNKLKLIFASAASVVVLGLATVLFMNRDDGGVKDIAAEEIHQKPEQVDAGDALPALSEDLSAQSEPPQIVEQVQQQAEAQLATLLGNITELEDKLHHDLQVAEELKYLYLELEALEPNHSRIGLGHEKIKSRYQSHLNSLVLANNYEDADLFLTLVGRDYPELAASDIASRIQQRQKMMTDVKEWLVTADRLLKSDRLSGDGNEHAYGYYTRVLREIPNHSEALKGIDNIVGRYLQLIGRHLSQQQFEQAQEMIRRAMRINSRLNAELVAAQSKLDAAIEKEIVSKHPQQDKINELLARAELLSKAGKDIQPEKQSALDAYREVLQLNPSDEKALAGVKELERYYRNEITQMLVFGNYQAVKEEFKRILPAFTETPFITDLYKLINDEFDRVGEVPMRPISEIGDVVVKSTISDPYQPDTDDAINLLQSESDPEISKILIQNEEFGQVDLPKPKPLVTARLVYIGFKYANFPDGTTLLTADLFDGGRTVKISTVPVIVNGESGEVFFRMVQPVSGFSIGSYYLDMSLNGKKIGSYQFLIEK